MILATLCAHSKGFLLLLLLVASCLFGQSTSEGYYSIQTDYEVGPIGHNYAKILATKDKGIVIGVCPLYSSTQQSVTTLVKLDSALNFVWGTEIDWLYVKHELAQDADGNILVLSTDTLFDSYVSKLTPEGTLLWTKKCTQKSYTESLLVVDGFYYVMGHIHVPGTFTEDKFVTKFNPDGQVIWSKLYLMDYFGHLEDAIVNARGEIVILGNVEVDNIVFGTHLLMIDTAGLVKMTKSYNYYDFHTARSIVQKSDGTYGITGLYDDLPAIMFTRIDSNGNFMNSARYTAPVAQGGTIILEKEDHFLIQFSSRNFLSSYAYRTGFLEVTDSGEPMVVKLRGSDGSGSFGTDAIKDSSGILSIGYGWEDKQIWIDRTPFSADFSCPFEVGTMAYEPVTLTEQIIPITVFDSIAYLDYQATQVPFGLNFTVNCYQKPPSSIDSGELPFAEEIDWTTILVPNIFTPDGDGINDEFAIPYSGTLSFQLQIINRWGELVFLADSASDVWNGRLYNIESPVTSGVYFYYLQIGSSGKHGCLTLIR